MSNIENDTDELAEKYDKLSNPQYENGKRLVNELLIEKGHSVLDVGCGTGRLALHTANIVGDNGKIIGIDPSPHRIKLATENVKKPNVWFSVGKAESLNDFSENNFDRAYLNAVLHWIEDKKSTLSEIHRVLKPGGKIGISAMPQSVQKALFNYRIIADDLLKNEPYVSQVRSEKETPVYPVIIDDLLLLLTNSGFQNIKFKLTKDIRYYQTPWEFLEFMESSVFGNFLANIPIDLRESFRNDIAERLEEKRTDKGIEHTSYTAFITAVKNN